MAIRNLSGNVSRELVGLDEENFQRYLSTRYDAIATMNDTVSQLQTEIAELQTYMETLKLESEQAVESVQTAINTVNTNLMDIADELPTQEGQAGKYLSTDGTSVLWKNVYAEKTGVVTNNTITSANGTIQKWTIQGTVAPLIQLNEGESITIHIEDGNLGTIVWTDVNWIRSAEPVYTGLDVVTLWKLSGYVYAGYIGSLLAD